MNVRILLARQHCPKAGSLTCLGRTHLELTGVNHRAAEMNVIAQIREGEPRTRREALGIKQTRDCGPDRPSLHVDPGGTDRAGARFGFGHVVPAAVELLQANPVNFPTQIPTRPRHRMFPLPPPPSPASHINALPRQNLLAGVS